MRRVGWVLVLALCAPAGIAPAMADDVADCKSESPDIAIAGCGKMLKGGKLNAQGKASAYSYRSRAYSRKGLNDEAFADATRAIDSDPKNANAYYARAAIYNRRGDTDRALEDLNKAIQLNPSYAWAYHARGAVHSRKGDLDRALSEYNRAIELDPKIVSFYFDRASAYARKDLLDRAVADCNKAIAIDARHAPAYYCLGAINLRKGEFDRAMSDYSRALEINPKYALAYGGRGAIYGYKGDFERALAELTRAIDIDPKLAIAYASRARVFIEKGEPDRAASDAERAIELDPKNAPAYKVRGLAALKRGQQDRALADLTRAIEIEPREAEAYTLRADIYLKRNEWGLAIADLRKVLSLPARNPRDRDAQVKAAETLTSLTQKTEPPVTIPVSAPVGVPAPPAPAPTQAAAPVVGNRVALVIGNSAYAHAGALRNPANDAKIIAGSLRQVGFTTVLEKYDLGLAQMTAALKEFGDRSAGADWAVIYFAGHGIEMGGVAYLVPTDAKIERDSHVTDETIPLDRMLQKTEGAKKLRLVILDACRNNPFVTRMVRTTGATRSIGQGLPALEVEGDVLVAYATKHGTTALDGSGDNSPFAMALAQNLASPNTDIRVMFGKVRDAVRKATSNQQEPYTYGSIGGDLHYFAVAAR